MWTTVMPQEAACGDILVDGGVGNLPHHDAVRKAVMHRHQAAFEYDHGVDQGGHPRPALLPLVGFETLRAARRSKALRHRHLIRREQIHREFFRAQDNVVRGRRLVDADQHGGGIDGQAAHRGCNQPPRQAGLARRDSSDAAGKAGHGVAERVGVHMGGNGHGSYSKLINVLRAVSAPGSIAKP